MPEWVHVVHKDLPETLEALPLVTRESYELMKENGWRLASKATVEAAFEPTETPAAKPHKSASKKRS